MGTPLKEYLASLEKVYPLDVNLVLPGHRNSWNNHKRRIEELQEHHQPKLIRPLACYYRVMYHVLKPTSNIASQGNYCAMSAEEYIEEYISVRQAKEGSKPYSLKAGKQSYLR